MRSTDASRSGLKPALLLVAAIMFVGCSKKDAAPVADEHKSVEPASRVHHGTNGEVVITLDAATQKVMGLQTAPLVAKELSPEVKAFGRVVDPAPLGDLLIELGRAELTYDNTHRELERMKVLKKDNNVSERAFETTEAQYRLDLAAVGAVVAKIQRGWGNKMAELTGPIVVPVGTQRKPSVPFELADVRNNFLVRLDLRMGEVLKDQSSVARIVGLDEQASPVEAQFFDFAPTVDPQTQSRGLFFLIAGKRADMTPGVAVTGFIKTDQQAESGVVVPRNAVVRFNGATWIYIQTGEENFSRVKVASDRPVEEGWFVRGGLKADDKVVTIGGQQLLSEELKSQVGAD